MYGGSNKGENCRTPIVYGIIGGTVHWAVIKVKFVNNEWDGLRLAATYVVNFKRNYIAPSH